MTHPTVDTYLRTAWRDKLIDVAIQDVQTLRKWATEEGRDTDAAKLAEIIEHIKQASRRTDEISGAEVTPNEPEPAIHSLYALLQVHKGKIGGIEFCFVVGREQGTHHQYRYNLHLVRRGTTDPGALASEGGFATPEAALEMAKANARLHVTTQRISGAEVRG